MCEILLAASLPGLNQYQQIKCLAHRHYTCLAHRHYTVTNGRSLDSNKQPLNPQSDTLPTESLHSSKYHFNPNALRMAQTIIWAIPSALGLRNNGNHTTAYELTSQFEGWFFWYKFYPDDTQVILARYVGYHSK